MLSHKSGAWHWGLHNSTPIKWLGAFKVLKYSNMLTELVLVWYQPCLVDLWYFITAFNVVLDFVAGLFQLQFQVSITCLSWIVSYISISESKFNIDFFSE